MNYSTKPEIDEIQESIAREITFEQNFEACNGRHTELRTVRVQPSDVQWDYVLAREANSGHDLTIAATREWWARRCRCEGEIMVLQQSESAEALDAIAERAGRIDWAWAMQQVGEADDEAAMDIEQELLDAAR